MTRDARLIELTAREAAALRRVVDELADDDLIRLVQMLVFRFDRAGGQRGALPEEVTNASGQTWRVGALYDLGGTAVRIKRFHLNSNQPDQIYAEVTDPEKRHPIYNVLQLQEIR